MSHIDVWAPRDAVEAALRPLWTDEPTTNRMGATEVSSGDACLIIAWSEPNGRSIVIVEAHDGDPEAEARRVYDSLSDGTSWRLTLWDDDGSYVLDERPALATA